MSDNININVTENIDQINIIASEVVEVVDLNLYATTEDVTINVTEEIIQVNINKVTGGSNVTKTSDLINDGEDGTSTYVETNNLGLTAFSNNYNDLDNLPTIPSAVTNTSDLINDGADGVNPFITLEDIPPVTGFVPYTGATQNVDLGEYEIKAGQVEFDQTPTGAAGAGVMRWNNTDGTLDLGLKGGNVTLQLGQEQVARVVNKTATNITLLESNYQVVKIIGATGQRLSVDLAQANNDLNSATTLGVVTETIANNQEGFITTGGQVKEINTTGSLQSETWADGDVLYLSPTTAGKITNIKPTAPNHTIIVGYVEYAHAIHGKIFVKVDNGYELEELHNVTSTNYTTPINTDSVLTYDVTTSLWKRLSWSNIKSNLKTYFDGIYESLSNKSTSTSLGTSNTLYPTQNAVKTYVDGKKQKIIFYNRSTWTFPNVAAAPFPLISSTNFELATANLNSTTDNALTALNNTSVIFMPIGIAPANMKLKRVILEGRQSFGSWQGFNLRCVVGSNRTIQASSISYSHLDSQVVEDFTHSMASPVGASNLFVNKEVTSSVVVPQNHGVIVMLSYSRTGVAISPVISTYLEFEIE
jgi:hypothetical protein